MADLWVSLAVLVCAVLVSESIRRLGARLVPASHWLYLLEAASTFQLCCCTHELKLLGESSVLDPGIGLSLTYSMTLVHLLTFREATCNPSGVLEALCRGNSSLRAAGLTIASQFAAGFAARFFAASVWTLGMSDVHVRHQKFGFRCFDPLGGTVLEAAAVELACGFFIQTAVLHLHKLEPKLRVHFIAAVITVLVWAGGSISGAVFNPVLAFSVQFPCSGHTYLEYVFIYWLGPLLGVASCILLFEKIIPFLSGKSSIRLDVPAIQKQKTQ